MTHDEPLASVYAALDVADETVRKLHAGCCRPERSPRMESLAETLTSAREGLREMDGDPVAADAVIGILEDAGSQLGHLQVNCCAPGRMKLYATTLENLTRAQRAINKSLARGH